MNDINGQCSKVIKDGSINSCHFPRVLLTNINHVLNNIDELKVVAESQNVDIICLTESWLDKDIPDNFCAFGDFSAFRKD